MSYSGQLMRIINRVEKQIRNPSKQKLDDVMEGSIHYIFSAGEAEAIAKENYHDLQALKRLATDFLYQSQITGSPSDFHNLSINYSKKDDYLNACKILEKGLELYPNNVDLLADYLNSGINCGQTSKLNHFYSKLQRIPKMRWSWRGFSFSIDYMLFQASNIIDESVLEKLKNEALKLADEYEYYYSDLQDVFICKYSIYHFFNQKEDAEKCLEEAMKKIRICDECALRYADIMFEKGEYDKAYRAVELCLKCTAQSHQKINISYAYMLSGLCKISLYYQQLQDNVDIIRAIYKDFQIARDDLNIPSYDIVMEKQIRILEIKSGVYYDDVIDE